MYLSLI